MQRYKPFSGEKPTLEDLEFNQDGIEAAVLSRQAEMFGDGVVQGLEIIETETGYALQPGVAYIAGERVEVGESKDLSLVPQADKQWVCLRHTTKASHPKQHFVTGEQHMVWVEDDWTIATYTDESSIPSTDLLLAVLLPDGSLEDHRPSIEVSVDDRIHPPNTDTHTTASEFRIGGSGSSPVLTDANMLSVSTILRDLFRRGVIDYQDGHGERELVTRKIPSAPNTPFFTAANIHVRIDESSGQLRSVSLALETYTQKQVAAQALATQITQVDQLRAMVVTKHLQGYTLDQIRGDANVGDAPDLEVRRLKNRMVVNGSLSNTRQQGSVTVTKNLSVVTGSGTAFTTALIGQPILLNGLGSDPVEYEVASVQSDMQLTLTEPVVENDADGLHWYLANASDVGFDGDATSTIDGLLAKVDTTLNSKVTDRSVQIADRDEQAQVLLQQDARLQVNAGSGLRTYTLLATWDRPALVDQEEIVGYQVRVVELDDGMTELPAEPSLQAFAPGGSYGTLVQSVNDIATPRRQQVEQLAVEDAVAAGSTTSQIVYTMADAPFRVNSRIVIENQSRVIRSVDLVNRTIELNQPLDSVPTVGKKIQAYRITHESDVESERFLMPVTPGRHYVLFLRSQSEYGLVSEWTKGVVVRTDDLLVAGGQSLGAVAVEENQLMASLQAVQQQQMTADWNEQLFSMQRVIAGTPTREEFVALQAEIIGGTADNPA